MSSLPIHEKQKKALRMASVSMLDSPRESILRERSPSLGGVTAYSAQSGGVGRSESLSMASLLREDTRASARQGFSWIGSGESKDVWMMGICYI